MVFYKNKWVKNIGRKITLYKNLDSLICMMNHQDAEHKETFKIFFIKIYTLSSPCKSDLYLTLLK